MQQNLNKTKHTNKPLQTTNKLKLQTIQYKQKQKLTNKPKGKKITFVKCKGCYTLHNATIVSNLHIQGKYNCYKKGGKQDEQQADR
jgi:hypothetical protein